MSNAPILLLENATIQHDKSIILQQVNVEINGGEFAYLIGKTGSGKSSLMKTFYGELPLKSGTGIVAGFDLKKLNWKTVPHLRRNIGIVFQHFQLLNDRNIQENLRFVLKATGWTDAKKIENKIEEVLAEVGLAGKGYRMPYELSGGEQQRVDIARAILNNPKLILADEPTGNLDPETTYSIMQLLFTICKEHNTAFLMATHDYAIIEKFPGRILKVMDGSLKELSSIYE